MENGGDVGSGPDRVGREGDEQDGFVQCSYQHMCESLNWLLGYGFGLHQLGEKAGDEAQPVALAYRAPTLPAEYSRTIQEHDLANLGPGAGVEPGVDTGDQSGQRIVTGDAGDDVDQVGGEVDLDRLQHGSEQLGLVAELVVQRSPGHTGCLRDTFGADLCVAMFGEQLARCGDEGLSGRGRAVGLGSSGRCHVDIHADCM